MYSLLRSLLFLLPAETSHNLTLKALRFLNAVGLLRQKKFVSTRPIRLHKLRLPNAVGLAAGLDKNGDYIDALGKLGFGFIEVGTVTPRPQPGNPKPRLFRIPQAEAIINRMGFNNKGIDHLVRNVENTKYKGVIGINIGKNFDTPINKAVEDYLICLEKAYPVADYITINISSPNTKNLRQLQSAESMSELLEALKQKQAALEQLEKRYVPIFVKIAPDLDEQQVQEIAQLLLIYGIDGVIATNTTVSRDGVQQMKHGNEAGGLSGAPLTQQATSVIKQLSVALEGKIPVIGVGGITSGADAVEKIMSGASVVQIYSGFIYRGPALIREIFQALEKLRSGNSNV
jgi:dihydroorotate dehydrogenase